jgi:hypothetical protein
MTVLFEDQQPFTRPNCPNISQCFGRAFRLHLQAWRISEESNWHEERTKDMLVHSLHLCNWLCSLISLLSASCLFYCSSLKIEAKYSSEMTFDIQWNARRYVSLDRTLHNLGSESLGSSLT